jgi:HSP20 family protein
MTVIRWNPVRDIAAAQNVVDRLFYDTWHPIFRAAAEAEASSLALDVYETQDGYTVTANIPGVQADQIQVQVEQDFLTISAELPSPTVQQEGTRTLLLERPTGRFSRRIQLPQRVDFSRAEAAHENGVLTLTLPKSPEAQPRLLTVKAGKGQNGNYSQDQ